MENNNVETIMNEFGLEEERAKRLLELAENDVSKARELFNKKIFIIKGHIYSENLKIYGLLLLVLNEKDNQQKINNLNVLVSQDKTLLSVPISESYSHFYKNFFDISFKVQMLTNIMNELNNFLYNNIANLSADDIYTSPTSINDKLLFDVIKNSIIKITKDNYIQVNLEAEPVSFVDFNIPKSSTKSDITKTGEDYKTEMDKAKEKEITLIKCDFILAPAKGKTVKELKVGDIIYAKIIDEKPEARKIVSFLKQKYDGKLPELRLPILKIEESESERLAIYVQLTEKMQGIIVANQEVKIKVYDPAEELSQNMVLDSKRYFIYIIIILIGLIILFFLIKSFMNI